jgi:hypothetical protein
MSGFGRLVMDKFAWGAIIIALIIEGVILYAYRVNINEQKFDTFAIASALPLVLIGTVFLFYWLQRGQT